MRRIGWVLFVVGLAVVLAVSFGDASRPLRGPAAVCAEDMACWDCASMGNQICGPRG
jgi:hypothetical protein